MRIKAALSTLRLMLIHLRAVFSVRQQLRRHVIPRAGLVVCAQTCLRLVLADAEICHLRAPE